MAETEEDGRGDDEAMVHAAAALSLLEAIILIMRERQLITEDELDDAYGAAIASHDENRQDHAISTNRRVARLLDRLRVHGNAVRLE